MKTPRPPAPISPTTTAYIAVRASLKPLLEGVVLSIDPSVGSDSSQPGWAVYQAGVLKDSGTLDIDYTLSLPQRLQRLRWHMNCLSDFWHPDIMVYEEISVRPFPGYGAYSHASLLKALGVVLATPGLAAHIGLRPRVWRTMTRPSYRKSDENDAIEMGWIAIELARWIQTNHPLRRRRTA